MKLFLKIFYGLLAVVVVIYLCLSFIPKKDTSPSPKFDLSNTQKEEPLLDANSTEHQSSPSSLSVSELISRHTVLVTRLTELLFVNDYDCSYVEGGNPNVTYSGLESIGVFEGMENSDIDVRKLSYNLSDDFIMSTSTVLGSLNDSSLVFLKGFLDCTTGSFSELDSLMESYSEYKINGDTTQDFTYTYSLPNYDVNANINPNGEVTIFVVSKFKIIE